MRIITEIRQSFQVAVRFADWRILLPLQSATIWRKSGYEIAQDLRVLRTAAKVWRDASGTTNLVAADGRTLDGTAIAHHPGIQLSHPACRSVVSGVVGVPGCPEDSGAYPDGVIYRREAKPTVGVLADWATAQYGDVLSGDGAAIAGVPAFGGWQGSGRAAEVALIPFAGISHYRDVPGDATIVVEVAELDKLGNPRRADFEPVVPIIPGRAFESRLYKRLRDRNRYNAISVAIVPVSLSEGIVGPDPLVLVDGALPLLDHAINNAIAVPARAEAAMATGGIVWDLWRLAALAPGIEVKEEAGHHDEAAHDAALASWETAVAATAETPAVSASEPF